MWFLGIDVGTTHLKVVGVTGEGVVLDPLKVRTPVRSQGDESYHDGDAVWSAVSALVRDYAAGPVAAAGCGALAAVSIATFGQEEAFPVDESGTPLAGSRVWWESWPTRALDPATVEWFDSVEHYRVTGMRFRDNQTPERLAQFRMRLPERWARTRHWVDFGSYLGFRLTGRWASSSTQLSHSQLIELATLEPHAASMERLGVDPSLLVPALRPGELVGHLLPGSLPGVALEADAVLRMGGHDQVMAAYATAAHDDAAVIDSIGTAEYVMVTGAAVVPDERLHALCADVEHGWAPGQHVIGWGLPTGKILQLLAERFLGGDFERLLAAIDPGTGTSRPATASGPALPVLFEVNDLRDLDGDLFSLGQVPVGADPDAVVRACVTQLSERIRDTVALLTAVGDAPMDRVALTGSLFQRAELVRHREQVWGVVLRDSSLEEAVATGAAMLARAAHAVAPGVQA